MITKTELANFRLTSVEWKFNNDDEDEVIVTNFDIEILMFLGGSGISSSRHNSIQKFVFKTKNPQHSCWQALHGKYN